MTTTATTPDAGPEGAATLFLRRRFTVPRARLFQAFTDPAAMVQWWGPKGCQGCDVSLDVRPGGKWRACMTNSEGQQFCTHGVYREVVENRRLVFTWIWESGDWGGLETEVRLEFKDSDGGSELVLTHSQLPSENSRDLHEQGWTSSLDCLHETLTA